MIQDVSNIQNMMRELVIVAVEKFARRIECNTIYNAGIAHAYMCILASLYNQAKLFHIPLDYLSLHTLDPEKAALSKQIVFFDKNLPIPKIKEQYHSRILAWLSDELHFIKELYKDCLSEADKDEFYNAVREGYKEVFALMEKYEIKVL